MTRQPCVLIGAIIAIPYDKTKFGEANRAETIAQHLEDAVRKTVGVRVVKWEPKHTSIGDGT